MKSTKPMGEPRYDCTICGKKGEERQKEINYLYYENTTHGTVWYNRCEACYYAHLDSLKKNNPDIKKTV